MKERGPIRRVVDKAGLVFSFVSFPLAIVGGGVALASGEFLKAAIAFGLAKVDHTQITEHGRSPDKQSWYNPERIMDGVQRTIGRFRLGNPSRLSYVS